MISIEDSLFHFGNRSEVVVKCEPSSTNIGKPAEFWPKLPIAEHIATISSSYRDDTLPGLVSYRLLQRLDSTMQQLGSQGIEQYWPDDDSTTPLDQDRQLRPKRKRISPEQLDALLGLFQQTDTPSFEQRERVAMSLGMSNREVQVWFQNRRAKERNSKQKQQLQEHKDRLERVQSTPGFVASTTPPASMPVSPLLGNASQSSPGQPTMIPLPPAFDPLLRRRSLSTSALDNLGRTTMAVLSQEAQHMSHAKSSYLPTMGPVRPKFNRYHTAYPYHTYARPASAQPEFAAPQAFTSRHRASSSHGSETAFAAPVPDGLALPIPHTRYRFGHSPTSSLSINRPDPLPGITIADRRESRLPPIRMLLDIADAAFGEFSPSISAAPSSLSCGLSPLSDLQLNTPGSQDGRQGEYFSARDTREAHVRTPTAPTPGYSFGRTFR